MHCWMLMLHVINPRLSCINITAYSFLSWISLFVELFFFSVLIFGVSTRLPFFLFPLNARHSGDHCVQPERRQVRTQPCKRQAQHFSLRPSLTLQTHRKWAPGAKPFSPVILPSSRLPTHPIHSSGLISRNTGQKQMTQWLHVSLCLPPSPSLSLPLCLSPTEPF